RSRPSHARTSTPPASPRGLPSAARGSSGGWRPSPACRASPRLSGDNAMRICLIYDCLFPWTVGGAERWYRALGERLAAQGHAVSYLTLRQWEPGSEPEIPGIEVVAVGPRLQLYIDGRRRIGPPLRFGWGVLVHLLRHGRG